jgi:hypothetical protein
LNNRYEKNDIKMVLYNYNLNNTFKNLYSIDLKSNKFSRFMHLKNKVLTTEIVLDVEVYVNSMEIEKCFKNELDGWIEFDFGNERNLDMESHINYLKIKMLKLDELLIKLDDSFESENEYMKKILADMVNTHSEELIKNDLNSIKILNERRNKIKSRKKWIQILKIEMIESFLIIYKRYPEFLDLLKKEYDITGKVPEIDLSLRNEISTGLGSVLREIYLENPFYTLEQDIVGNYIVSSFSSLTNNNNNKNISNKKKYFKIKKLELERKNKNFIPVSDISGSYDKELFDFNLEKFNGDYKINMKSIYFKNTEIFNNIYELLNSNIKELLKNEKFINILSVLVNNGVYKKYVIVHRYSTIPNREYIIDYNINPNKINYNNIGYDENILFIKFTSLNDLISETRENLFSEIDLGVNEDFEKQLDKLTKNLIITRGLYDHEYENKNISQKLLNLKNKGFKGNINRFKVNSLYKNCLFLFRNMSKEDIVREFRKNRIYISGGMNTLKGYLSPVDFKLSIFIYNLLGKTSYEAVLNSFNTSSDDLLKSKIDPNEKIEAVPFKKPREIERFILNRNGLVEHYIPGELKTIIENFIQKNIDNSKIGEKLEILKQNGDDYSNKNYELNLSINKKNISKLGNREYHNFIKKIPFNSAGTGINKRFISSIIDHSLATQSKLDNFKDEKIANTKIVSEAEKIESMISIPTVSNLKNSLLEYIFILLNDKDLSSYNKQFHIEMFWNNLFKDFTNTLDYKVSKIKYSIPTKLNDHIKSIENIEKKYKENPSKLNKKFKYFPYLFKYKKAILMITYSTGMHFLSIKQCKWTAICSKIGDRILNLIYKEKLYRNLKISDFDINNISLNNFLNDKNKQNLIINKLISNSINYSYEIFINELEIKDINQEYIKLGNYFLELLCLEPFKIFERKIGGIELNYSTILSISEDTINNMNEVVIDFPSLPMVCLPKPWSDKNKGGFILNFSDSDSSVILGHKKHGHKVENMTILFDTINYLNSIEFSINNDFLNFLETDKGKIFVNKEINNMDKSDLFLFNKTLLLAKLFSNTSFYLPTKADFRGRIYVSSYFLNYQGNDFSRGFINYSKGMELNDKGLENLYVYGASLYNENNMSKNSLIEKIDWTNKNMERILNMDIDFISNSDNKWLFISFCLVIQNLYINKHYKVKLPIYIDASCSGIQHVASMIRDIDLASQVNLEKQKPSDRVKDIYSSLVIKINEAINSEGFKENSLYPKFKYIKLERKDVKLPIMTKTYNVSLIGMKEQISNQMEKIKVYKDNSINQDVIQIQNNSETFILIPTVHGEKVKLNFKELFKLVKIIDQSIFTNYPYLEIVYNYFKDMANLLSKLGLPVIWSTPAGIVLTQLYYKKKITKINLSDWGKTKTLVLNEHTKNLDSRAQSNAIIPNIIHSLDSAHLMEVIKEVKYLNMYSVLPIHDCFGIHPNDINKLFSIIKLKFIELYSKEIFLEKFHKNIINFIKQNNIKVKKIKNIDCIILPNGETLYIPNLPKSGKFNLEDIKESLYMFN